MFSQLRPALVSLVLFTILTGIVYPAIVTGVSMVAFPREASGSIIEQEGRAVGSELIAQPFSNPKYFWPRPSAAAYNGASSGGSNYGPMAPALREAVQKRIAELRAADPGNDAPIPVDLVTASGSGLDPHISVAAAQYQLGRVARSRGLATHDVQAIVDRLTEDRTFGLLGEQRVNVLKLNLALDGASAPVPATQPHQ